MIVLDRSALRVTLAAVALGLLSGAGCRQDAAPPAPLSVEQRRELLEREQSAPTPSAAAIPQEPSDGAAAVPAQLLAIYRQDLARRALVPPQDIVVVRTTEQHWPDGSLGCPQPGRMYTQAIVPGYQVVLQAAGKDYVYHTDRRGGFIVCDQSQPVPPVREQLNQPELE